MEGLDFQFSAAPVHRFRYPIDLDEVAIFSSISFSYTLDRFVDKALGNSKFRRHKNLLMGRDAGYPFHMSNLINCTGA